MQICISLATSGTANNGIRIEDCVISGATSSTGTTVAGIYLSSVTNCVIQNCYFTGNGLTQSDPNVYSVGSAHIFATSSTQIKVLDNTCVSTMPPSSSSPTVSDGMGFAGCQDVTVTGNYIYGAYSYNVGGHYTSNGYGIYVYGGTAPYYHVISKKPDT
jgi:Right handed beta helix region